MLISKHFTRICKLSLRSSTQGIPTRSSSPLGIKVSNALDEFANLINPLLDPEAALARSFSKGQSNLPKVLWIAFLPKGRTVSTHISLAICFGPAGEGAVAGLMAPSTQASKLAPLVNRTSTDRMQVNVDGPKSNTRYNDRFINPREFLMDDFDEESFLAHLYESSKLFSTLMQRKEFGSGPRES